MTNGEKFKEVFKDTIADVGYDGLTNITKVSIFHNHYVLYFLKGWWNAEYKEPTIKNDLGVDAVSRKAVINQIFYSTDNNGDVVLGSALRERIARLPSVTPQLSSGLEKNSKKLEKNFGELDCISREQALRKLKESAEHHANDSREEVLLRRDRDIIRALPSVTPQEPRWIPVSERLPEENICDDGYHEPSELILAYMKSGEMHVARYWSRYDYRWLGIITPTTDEVIAWMPLPKAYREVEE